LSFGPSQAPPKTSTTKLLLSISELYKSGQINQDERAVLKNLALKHDKTIICALRAFEVDNDWEEFMDTLKKVYTIHSVSA